jgi:uncharacterized membrane protein YfcA
MPNFQTFDLSTLQWAVLATVAVFIGIAKTGIPGFGVLVVPLAAMTLPAKISIGVVLPMLMFADIFAIAYYRRHADWKHIAKLLPATLVGIAAGFILIDRITNQQLKPIIGAIVLLMLALYTFQQFKNSESQKQHLLLAPILGSFAGFTTMLANAAGPVTSLYFVMNNLPKKHFVGTSAWFFFIVNWTKVPLFVRRDLISMDSLKLNLTLAPMILIGVALGIFALKRIPQKAFNITVQALAALAAIKLLIP